MNDVSISIQEHDFNFADELEKLEQDNQQDGAVVSFLGRVRNKNLGQQVTALFLEHYPQMTEKSLQQIVQRAQQRWQLGRICIIHRVGLLAVGEKIVMVAVTSQHRSDAFEATQFIMDFLKVEAPFWKKEVCEEGEKWLSPNQTDVDKAAQW
ncbi:MAG: molybdopterin synthase catalytic subunit MoaE [Psychrobium sp.]|nr:molybdopterin synthase catalytic subunit MoaE [Psychrobium sp.]